MIPILLFPLLAAMLVFLAGRGDTARDPRLTTFALGLLAIFPVLAMLMPKAGILPMSSPVGGAVEGFPWIGALVTVWLTGSFVMALRLGLAMRGIACWRTGSQRVGISEGVEIRCLPGLRGPVAAGVFRPVIFVPESWPSWPAVTREMVLAHEMNHHRRRDPLWRWIAEIACVVNGGNPLVIWMTRRLAVQCEFACDAAVVERGAGAGDYAKVLCDFAEERPVRCLALAMAERSSLESRVRRLISPGQRMSLAGLMSLVVLAMLVAGALASVGGKVNPNTAVPQREVDLRWSANPFPGER